MHCVYCGNQNSEGAAVCQNCGRTLPPQQSKPSWGEAPSYPPPATQPTDPGGGSPPSGGWAPPSSPAPWAPSSYPPPVDPGFGGTSFGNDQSSSFGNQPPSFGAPSSPPSFGAAPFSPPQGGFGGAPAAWAPPPPTYGGYNAMSPAAESAKKQAIAGLVCSIVGVICCQIILGPIGIVLGFMAKSSLQKAGVQDGQSVAIAAMVIGGIDIVLFILYMLFSLATGVSGF